ncbi:glutathione S-transferase family protein [Roseobacter sinensis]|uniref:Glutathione S-transferase family protein n=1 Tax=Roseobacter sinensis TaxID=2931391 RepID=A0ABT3B904_9RHOB|nr:glutathione S-transferase family protein [Roseobacter sp. WL0113]MCV3269919.1 glutathione S-transferase family protein [Roseobacter sp. WL0113]
MITLLTYPPAFGQFSGSPFCIKAAHLLNLSGQRWTRENTLDPRMMPHQKLPVIRAEDQLIADSDMIRAYLEAQGAQFDDGLTEMDKSTSRAFIRMAEEHLYFHIVLDRWGNDAAWPEIRETYFASVPRIFRRMVANSVRRKLLSAMYVQGLGRFTPAQRLARLEPDFDAIMTRLWQNRFLFGERPSAADASVGPMLSAAISSPGETALSNRIRENAVLMGYIERVEEMLH